MKPVHIDKQSAVDAALMIIGSAIGASASVAFIFYRWVRTPIQGDAPAKTGEAK